jgi:hypothetical protein
VGLIAAAVEGGVALRPLDGLVAHIERCAACAAEAETQMLVKRLLGTTPMLPLPPGAAGRLNARLDREAASRAKPSIDWRAWTVRLVPVAACLVAIAAVLHHVIRRSHAIEVSAAIADWGRDEVRSLQSPRIDQATSDRQLLGVLLMDPRHDAPAGRH